MKKNALIPLSVALGLLVLYYFQNPLHSFFFPKCPFFFLTGYRCGGCGSQRALHYLLHGQFEVAIEQNLLFVACLPILMFLYLNEWVYSVAWVERNKKELLIALAIGFLVFGVGRQVF